MKKLSRRLALERTTLRTLGARHLARAVGGLAYVAPSPGSGGPSGPSAPADVSLGCPIGSDVCATEVCP
jgi:hypothetical protein